MIIQVELIILLTIILILLFWSAWYRFSLKQLRKQWEKINNDKHEKGGEERGNRDFDRRERETPETHSVNEGYGSSRKRKLLQATNTDIPGKNLSGPGNSIIAGIKKLRQEK